MKKQKRDPRYTVVAMYQLKTFGSFHRDDDISKLVGRDPSGSGTSLIDGERDLSFRFFTRPAALKARDRLKLKRIKTYFYDNKSEET